MKIYDIINSEKKDIDEFRIHKTVEKVDLVTNVGLLPAIRLYSISLQEGECVSFYCNNQIFVVFIANNQYSEPEIMVECVKIPEYEELFMN